MTAPHDTTIWSLMGPLLRHHRQLAGHTQAQLASMLQTTQEYVCSRELGRGGLTIEMLYRWALACECSAMDLMPVDADVRRGLQPRQPARRRQPEPVAKRGRGRPRKAASAEPAPRRRQLTLQAVSEPEPAPAPDPTPAPAPVVEPDLSALAPKKRIKRSGLAAAR